MSQCTKTIMIGDYPHYCIEPQGHDGQHRAVDENGSPHRWGNDGAYEPDYWTRFRAETAARMMAAYRTILQQEARPDNAETAARWSALDTDVLISELRKGEAK